MKLVEKVVKRLLMALLIAVWAYVLVNSFDGSMAFNDERVAAQRAQCEQARIEIRR